MHITGLYSSTLADVCFYEGLSLMDIGHKPTCVSTLTLAAVGSSGCCKSPFDYFSAPRFSNSLSIKRKMQVI